MQREIVRVLDRCRTCGMAESVEIREGGLDDATGEPYLAIWAERLEHKRSDCEAFLRLQREEWPTLF